ncbi:MAG: hypothetical protein HQL37_08285 [Alphaproteobacteria bacterium]|nr:hypothetical protein [Alphaproteobacteria bacterium]
MSSTLLSIFSEIPDPRRGQGKIYPLAPICCSRCWRCWPESGCIVRFMPSSRPPERRFQLIIAARPDLVYDFRSRFLTQGMDLCCDHDPVAMAGGTKPVIQAANSGQVLESRLLQCQMSLATLDLQ